MKEYLFSYGTLLPEYAPGEISSTVRGLECVGSAFVLGRLYDLGEYPGAILDPTSQMKVVGKVFALPEDQNVLKSLDSYEGFKPEDLKHSLFVREQTTVTLDGGGKLSCWIYVYNQDLNDALLVASGDYKKYQAA